MDIRTLTLLIAVSAFAAHAQEDVPPPLVTPEEGGPAVCATSNDCAAGSLCFSGVCTPSCVINSDCAAGSRCVGHRPLGEGKWTRGVCQARRPAKARAPREPVHEDGDDWASRPGKPTVSPESTEPPQLIRESARETERYQFRGAIPAGFHLVTEPTWGLVGGGIAAFSGAYLLSAVIGLLTRSYGGLIPLVGTIVMTAEAWGSVSGGGGWGAAFFEGLAKGMLITGCLVDVALQVAGVVMIAVGLGAPKRWLERDDGKPSLTFAPGAAGTPLGASVLGRF